MIQAVTGFFIPSTLPTFGVWGTYCNHVEKGDKVGISQFLREEKTSCHVELWSFPSAYQTVGGYTDIPPKGCVILEIPCAWCVMMTLATNSKSRSSRRSGGVFAVQHQIFFVELEWFLFESCEAWVVQVLNCIIVLWCEFGMPTNWGTPQGILRKSLGVESLRENHFCFLTTNESSSAERILGFFWVTAGSINVLR